MKKEPQKWPNQQIRKKNKQMFTRWMLKQRVGREWQKRNGTFALKWLHNVCSSSDFFLLLGFASDFPIVTLSRWAPLVGTLESQCTWERGSEWTTSAAQMETGRLLWLLKRTLEVVSQSLSWAIHCQTTGPTLRCRIVTRTHPSLSRRLLRGAG